jgi:hypothetical protein
MSYVQAHLFSTVTDRQIPGYPPASLTFFMQDM